MATNFKLFLYMKQINEYIFEKLKIDKEVNKKISEDNLYKVKAGDKVLIIAKSPKSNDSRKYINVSVGTIEKIQTETFEVGGKHQMVYIDKLEDPLFMEDPKKTSPNIPNTFAFRSTFDRKWKAAATREKADMLLQNAQKNIKSKYFFSTFWLDSTHTKQTTIDLLRRELNI